MVRKSPKTLLPANAVLAAARFNAERALATAVRVYEVARGMDSRAVCKTAELVAEELRTAGLRDVRIEELPADGRTVYGGWRMPLAWTLSEATLRTGGGMRPVELLADAREVPQHLATYSPGTPGDRWMEGPVVTVDDAGSLPQAAQGAFIRVGAAHATPEFNAAAALAGALGVLVCVPNDDPTAVRYLNYAVPFDAIRPCVPCFSLSPAAQARLNELLRADPALRVQARVRARRRKGTLPLVTAILGEGVPSLYLCAHLDEPGAQDNASGVGTAVETLRTLAATPATGSGDTSPPRAIQIFFSMEVRGLHAWLNQQRTPPPFLAGLNLDMVGCAPDGGQHTMVVRRGFPGQPHFAGVVLDAAAQWADAAVGGMPRTAGTCGVSDAVFGGCPDVGHVSLEQRPGTVYHTSRDLASILDVRAVRWSGVASTAFLETVRRLDNPGVLHLAKAIQQRARQSEVKPSDGTALGIRHALGELTSLRGALRTKSLFGDWNSPAALYRAGVRRSSGCWPWVEASRRLEDHVAALTQEAGTPPRRAARDDRARRVAKTLVPRILFRGFLSFEDASASELAPLGLKPGWGTEPWAWIAAARFRGKATVADVVDELERMGVHVELNRAVALAQYLVAAGKAQLRPLLDRRTLARTFRAMGVRRGSVLCLQAGLSHFGYIVGGPQTVINAVLDVLGPKGTLCVPVHSLSVIGNEPYDVATSPSRVGAVSEFFRTLPGVVRSPHPTHSVAVLGPAAAELTHLDRIDAAPLARDGFWGKLYDAGGDVLVMCPLRSATIFHAGEAWSGVPQPPLLAHVRQPDGLRRVVTVPQGPWHVDHFEEKLAAPLLASGTMRKASLGEGTLFFASARAMADISVAVNRATPLVSLGRDGACRCFYCEAVRKGVGQP